MTPGGVVEDRKFPVSIKVRTSKINNQDKIENWTFILPN